MAARTKTYTIDQDAVARRAYERYASRGYTDGHDQGDWYAAEAELRAEAEYDYSLRPGGKPAPKTTATKSAATKSTRAKPPKK